MHSWPLSSKIAQLCKTRVLLFLLVTPLLAGCMGLVQGTTTSTSNPQPAFSANPVSLNFGNVTVGTTSNLSVTITNSGTANLAVSQASISGSAFTLSGASAPLTLTPGQSASFTVQFAPSTTGNFSGTATVVSNATNSPLTIPITGTGVQAGLSVNPTTLNFGNIGAGSTASLSVAATNSGTTALNISQVTISGAAFTLTGLSTPMTLSAGQSTGFSVQFAPMATTNYSGTVTIASSAPNSPTIIPITGAGVTATSHFVDLSWVASATSNVTYNVYRGTVSGGPYLKVNPSTVPGVTYSDSSVTSGATYFYVVTAVDANNDESVYSNQVTASIP